MSTMLGKQDEKSSKECIALNIVSTSDVNALQGINGGKKSD